jgi:hypothetical protein
MNNKSWKNRRNTDSIIFVAPLTQYRTVIMCTIILMITFCLLTKGYRTVHVLQTNNNYISSFEYHNLHISVPISNCSWNEFHMEILKHSVRMVERQEVLSSETHGRAVAQFEPMGSVHHEWIGMTLFKACGS